MTDTAHPPESGRYSGRETALQAALVCLAVCLAAAVVTEMIPIRIAKIGAVVLFAWQIWHEIGRGERSFLMTPPFLLSAVALVGFSVVPGIIYAAILAGIPPGTDTSVSIAGFYRPMVTAYFGSAAERLIVGFALAGLAVHGGARLLSGSANVRCPASGTDDRHHARLLFALSVALTLLYLLVAMLAVLGPSMSGLFRTVFGPAQSFLLLYLLHCAVRRGSVPMSAVLVLAAVTIGLMIVAGGGKIPVLIVLSAGIYYAVARRLTLAGLLKAFLAFSLFLFLGMQIIQVIRAPHVSVVNASSSTLKSVENVVVSKLLWRQAETGYCLKNVIGAHADEKFEASRQTFWLEILVPRVLWASKPDFSLGNQYAMTFCGMTENATTHSASITLLGQPYIHGGSTAMLLHVGILLFVLGVAGVVSVARPGLPRVVVFALLPWWIDFDQDFALYVGNLVKFGIFMIPLILLTSARFHRRLQR